MKRKTVFLAVAVIALASAVAIGCGSQASSSGPARPAAAVASRTVTPLRAGTYTQTVRGNSLGMVVEVVLSTNRIEKVSVISHHETAGILQAAIDTIPAAIVNQQSIAVDVVTGATLSSRAIMSAVGSAITEAGGNVDDYFVPGIANANLLSRQALLNPLGTPRGPEQTPRNWNETYEIVVVGGGYAGLAAAHAAKSNGANVLLVEKMAFLGGEFHYKWRANSIVF